MGTCSVCEDDGLTRNCNHCGREVCSTHTLPEKHDCPAVAHYGEGTKRLQSDIDAKLGNDSPNSTSSRDGSRTESGSSRSPSDLPSNPARPSTATRREAASKQPTGDSSPDVAPDGSIAEPSTASMADADATSSRTLRERVQFARLKFEIYWRRAFLLVTSLKVWLVVLVAIASMGQLGLAPVPGMPIDDSDSNAAMDEAAAWADGLLSGRELNESMIEAEIHDDINDRRESNGLQPLEFDSDLQQAARSHSRTVGEDGGIVVEGPVGESVEEQYADHGIDCRVPAGDGSYSTGAANYGYTYAWEDVETDWGETVYHSNEEEVADGVVNQWMNDSGTQNLILTDYWQREGIGVFVTEVDGKTRVYVTQYFC